MNNSLSKICLSKSLMVTILLWVSTSIPISYFEIEIHSSIIFASLITLSALLLTVLPVSYLCFLYKYRCPKCRSFWCFSHSEDKIIDSAIREEGGRKMKISRVISTYSCGKCGYTKTNTKITKENL